MFLNEEFLNIYEELNPLNEWVDIDNKKITPTSGGLLYSGAPEICDACGQVVEHPYDKFTKPFDLVNGHKLCSSCLTEWIKLPEGFVDKVILISCYNNGECDQVIDDLKLTQADIDDIVATWNQKKKAGQLTQLSAPRIQEIEDDFVETIELLKLEAKAMESLKEWVDKDGNKIDSSISSSITTGPVSSGAKTMKERFTSLLYYIKRNKDRTVTKTEITRLQDTGFDYQEERTRASGYTYTYLLKVIYNPFNNEWTFALILDNKLIDRTDGTGIKDLIKTMGAYVNVPSAGTPEYKKITESLNEWVDKDGKKITLGATQNSTSVNTSSLGPYKKRFEKLIKYHINHSSSELESITKKDIQDYSFHLSEHHNDGRREFDKDIVASVDKTTNKFHISFYIDGKEVADRIARDFKDFLIEIQPFMNIPASFEPEYSDMLTEWVDAQGKKVTLGSSAPAQSNKKLSNRDKFIEVTDFMKAHPNPHTTKSEVTRIDDTGFTYKELRSIPNANDITLAVNCNHSRFSDAWSCEIYRNNKIIEDTLGHGWPDLLRLLNAYFNAPMSKDPIYQNLTEWIDSNGNKINISNTSVNKSAKGGYWGRFNKLLFYHVNHKSPGVDKVVRTKVSKDGFHYTEHHRSGVSGYEYDVVVKIDPSTESWTFQTSIDGSPFKGGSGNGYLNLLKELRQHMRLPAEGSKDYDKLLVETYSSIIDDFQAYETLWD